MIIILRKYIHKFEYDVIIGNVIKLRSSLTGRKKYLYIDTKKKRIQKIFIIKVKIKRFDDLFLLLL